MWTGFSVGIIYDEHVTYLEVLAAEPFCLGLVCFILQNIEEDGGTQHTGFGQGRPAVRQRRSMFLELAFQQRPGRRSWQHYFLSHAFLFIPEFFIQVIIGYDVIFSFNRQNILVVTVRVVSKLGDSCRFLDCFLILRQSIIQ